MTPESSEKDDRSTINLIAIQPCLIAIH